MATPPDHATHPVPEKPPELKTVVGTGMARFLNQYNPQYDRPFDRPHPNLGLVLDPELTKALEEERNDKMAKAHNRRKDWMKHYMDECVKFQAITKGKK